MKKMLITSAIILLGLHAHADTIAVEFQKCSDNQINNCALVYGDHGREEIAISTTDEINTSINKMLEYAPRSVAMNIEGFIRSGDNFSFLEIDSLTSDSDTRPR